MGVAPGKRHGADDAVGCAFKYSAGRGRHQDKPHRRVCNRQHMQIPLSGETVGIRHAGSRRALHPRNVVEKALARWKVP